MPNNKFDPLPKLVYEEMKIGEVRTNIQEQLDAMSFAGKLWQQFRSVVSGMLHELENQLGYPTEMIMAAIDDKDTGLFYQQPSIG